MDPKIIILSKAKKVTYDKVTYHMTGESKKNKKKVIYKKNHTHRANKPIMLKNLYTYKTE